MCVPSMEVCTKYVSSQDDRTWICVKHGNDNDQLFASSWFEPHEEVGERDALATLR